MLGHESKYCAGWLSGATQDANTESRLHSSGDPELNLRVSSPLWGRTKEGGRVARSKRSAAPISGPFARPPPLPAPTRACARARATRPGWGRGRRRTPLVPAVDLHHGRGQDRGEQAGQEEQDHRHGEGRGQRRGLFSAKVIRWSRLSWLKTRSAAPSGVP